MRYPLLFTLTLLTSFLILNPSAEASDCYSDYTPPVAVCDAHTVVALGADGVATVYAYNLDDGSYDNCHIDHFKAARMWPGWCPYGVVDDTQFRPYVQFCCEDVGSGPIWIILKVTDTHGNSNTCMVEVTVQSGSSDIHCPYDKTVYCADYIDWDDLYDPWNSFYGWPTSSGGCNSSPNVTVQVFDHRNQCGTGHIKRVFSTGGGGYGYGETTCIQFIWVVDYNSFNCYSIHWPDDYHADGCDDVHTDPDDLPYGYGKPTWPDDDNCNLIGYSWEDKVFHFEGGTCTKIVRKWTVIDWCVYDPNNHYSGGICTHTQIIKLSDHDAPVFENCYDITINGSENDCKGRFKHHPEVWDFCTPFDDFKFEYKIDLYANGSHDIIKHGHKYIDELLPSGKHKVFWYVDDNCGNVAWCSFFVKVEDKKAPTPVCFANLSTVLMPQGGMVTIWAKDFDASSFDNCTKVHQLKFSFSPDVHEASRTFTCDDVGLVPLKVYVTDLSGNQAYCNTFITLTDNGPVCPEMNPLTGTVEMFTAEAIAGADVALYKVKPTQTGNEMVMDMQQKSAADGSFKVGFGTTQFDRMLDVTKTAEPLEGISTLDILLIQHHIMGIDLLDHPAQMKAADIDGSGRVGVSDLLMLRDALLSTGRTLNGATLPWEFYRSDCEWLASGDLGCAPEYTINHVSPAPSPYDFIGYKMGDINGSIMSDRSQQSIVRYPIGVKYDKSEQAYAFIALEDTDILGMQLSFGTSLTMSKSDLAGGELNVGSQNTYVDDDLGVVNMSWTSPTSQGIDNGQILFYLSVPEFYALRGNQFSWNKGVYNSEIYLSDKRPVPIEIRMLDAGQQVDPLLPTIAGQELQTENSITQRSSGSVDREATEPFFAPNPIADAGVLYFRLTENQEANFEVFTSDQKLVVSQRLFASRGLNEVVVSAQELGLPGVFLYRLTVGDKAYTGKIIMVD